MVILMKAKWKQEFFQQLEEKMGEFTQQNLLEVCREGEFRLRSVFAVSKETAEDCVLVETGMFEIKQGLPQLELIFLTDLKLEEKAIKELEKVILNMNYYLPIGALGIFYPGNRVLLRQILFLEEKRELSDTIEDIVSVYEIGVGVLRELYIVLKQVCMGELSYEEAVEKGVLLKQENIKEKVG